ncbi:MAG: N,N'-diacetyllegionaminic acid synthase [Chloroflexi bacterium ADurb.Bin120]|jgi:N-acetylneuraminate synthase|uniref:Putative N-acetylneuraminate synthase n=1 Tax=Candidatus Brevifilum fermentans TaxID=1986204 RepID=A0A1Y6K6F9_9CHLR|nr:N-acetylneuraminate synthase family protein [Brevefilum fermentans]MDI9566097.1 N-acetylneuraminate synthase family protein [Chloroflexota bacterium]OQB83569.1 MAG: N,N'-diacetyllegionaminic acid synthase [Chloroflexi bacterium ADurb.Bin120]SMX55194.1 putative N-acetylneuraminate synthase [Brevefilum fermentans]HOM68005.1 N-acetylneuraminate synthase family protein [Brevefilum fermentans]
MNREIQIGTRLVGDGHPTYIIAEIGINHNGRVEIARELIKAAVDAGVDAVKFQKRTPAVSVPDHQKDQMRDTPWGYITYLDYRYKVEFGRDEFDEIDAYCKSLGIDWLASSWDLESLAFIDAYNPPAHKIPSALLTDHELLRAVKETGKPAILSTGMSTMEEIQAAVDVLGLDKLLICHTTSSYPCPPDELNLRMIQTLQETFDCPIGYSGHEVGLVTSAIAVGLGACLVERHVTLDRAMWGTDQAASVEPQGMRTLVKYIRVTEKALGDGVKHVYDSEQSILKKLRKYST